MFEEFTKEEYLSNFIGKFGYKMSPENIVRNVVLAAIENGYKKIDRNDFCSFIIGKKKLGLGMISNTTKTLYINNLLKDEDFIDSLAKIIIGPNYGIYKDKEYKTLVEETKKGLILEVKEIINLYYTKISNEILINDLFIFILQKNILLKIMNYTKTNIIPDITQEEYNNIINSLYFKESYVRSSNYDKKYSYNKRELQVNDKGELNYIK